MEVNKLINNSEFGKITAYIGDFKLDSGKILPNMKDDKTVEEYFLYICDTEKLKKALAVLDIKEDVLVCANNKTVVTENDGRAHRTNEIAILFFYKKRWFNNE